MTWREWLRKLQPGAKCPAASVVNSISSSPSSKGGTLLRVNEDREPRPYGRAAHAIPLTVPIFAVGDRISDTYRVRQVLEGGMARVYVCHHEKWDIELVVKIAKPEVLADSEHAHRIRAEAESWTALGLHPHIAYCYYVHPLEEIPAVIIEYMDGGNLREWITAGKAADLRGGG